MINLLRTTLLAALLATFSCAQTPSDFHWFTLGAGAGYSFVAGQDGSSLSGQWDFEAEAGFAVVNRTNDRPWSLFLDFDYLFDDTSIKSSALSAARNLNPTNIALLNATGGNARFNVLAFDPTIRWTHGRMEIYGFGGFGWFRRQVNLTGVASQGSLLQPGSPSVFFRNASSGSIDGGGGINFLVKGWAVPYVEFRVVHGLAVNKNSTLVPISVGIRW